MKANSFFARIILVTTTSPPYHCRNRVGKSVDKGYTTSSIGILQLTIGKFDVHQGNILITKTCLRVTFPT